MKKYIVFYGEDYYPLGGSQDKHKFFETEQECQDFILLSSNDKKNYYGVGWFCYLDIEKDITKYYSDGKFLVFNINEH